MGRGPDSGQVAAGVFAPFPPPSSVRSFDCAGTERLRGWPTLLAALGRGEVSGVAGGHGGQPWKRARLINAGRRRRRQQVHSPALRSWLEKGDFGHSGAFCAPSPGIAPKSWEEKAREMDWLNRDHPSKKKKRRQRLLPAAGPLSPRVDRYSVGRGGFLHAAG